MSLSTLTRYLRLRIATDLSQQASQNLARLDSLGFTFGVGETDDLEVRSRGNIVLKPEATVVGGAGSGGEVHLGSASQPVAIKFFASSFSVAGGAGNLLTEDSLNTVTNKSISGSSNLLSNIGYSSLLLSNSIKGSDIAADAAIPDSKLATISTAGKVNVSALTGSLSGSLLPSYTDNSGKYLSLNNGSLEWSTVAAGGVTSVNGQTGNVTISVPVAYTNTDADARVSAGISSLKGIANGLASLGSDGKVPTAQLTTAPVTSVNGQTGNVTISLPTQYTDSMADSRADARIAAVKGQASGLASLDGNGKLPTSQLPSLAITSTAVVNSQSQMLNLVAEEGDVAIRTDNGKTYILSSNSPSSLADWKEITAGGAVTAVNGKTGSVSLSTTDINEGSNQYYTAARFTSEFSTKSTSDLTEGSNLYHTAARAKSAAVSANISDSDQGKAPSISLLKTYAISSSNLGKETWFGGNSLTITHGYGTKDIEWTIFDSSSGERIVVDNVTWGSGNNSFTLTLPTGIVAGSWRVMYWVR